MVNNTVLIYCSDPFHDAFKDNEGIGVSAQEGFVHIRIQQRNGRKTVTTVQGIGDEYDKKKIVKVCKKVRVQKFYNVTVLYVELYLPNRTMHQYYSYY